MEKMTENKIKATHVIEGLELIEESGTPCWVVHFTPLHRNKRMMLYFYKEADLENFNLGQMVRLEIPSKQEVKEKI